jgi:transcriptional regulator with XRE-family HTH domain
MTTPMSQEVDRLISEFLEVHEHPSMDAWKALADRHPRHAAAIADAAAIRAAGDAAEALEEPYEFDPALATRTVSKALAMVYARTASIDDAQRKVAQALPGPAERRELAMAVGLGTQISLLNGVLSGRTRPARQVLRSLARWLEVAEATLLEVFAIAFAADRIPANKALHGKPVVQLHPVSWEQAVRSLGLSDEETAALLRLDDEISE